MTMRNNGAMTQGPDDGATRRPSWYSGAPGAPSQKPVDDQQGQSPSTHSQHRQAQDRRPPTAAEAGGYGVPQPGHPPPGYGSPGSSGHGYPGSGYSGHPGPPGHPGYYPPAGPYSYSPTPGTDELNRVHSVEARQAQSAATAALVLAIIGFFTAPFLLGPLAIWQAAKARRLGHAATPGWVLGWTCTLWGGAIVVLPFLLVLLSMMLI